MLLTQCFHLAFQPQKTPCFGTVARELCRWRRTHKHTYTPTRTHTQLFPSLTEAHESSSLPALLAIASMCEWTTFSWGSSRSGQSRAPDFLLDHSYWAEKMTPFLTSHTLPQVIRFKIKNKSSGNLFQGREGGGRGTLTFLHCLERVVRLDKFHRVGDFLALQNVIAQTQVWDGKLENLVISYSVFFEYGTCWVKQ